MIYHNHKQSFAKTEEFLIVGRQHPRSCERRWPCAGDQQLLPLRHVDKTT